MDQIDVVIRTSPAEYAVEVRGAHEYDISIVTKREYEFVVSGILDNQEIYGGDLIPLLVPIAARPARATIESIAGQDSGKGIFYLACSVSEDEYVIGSPWTGYLPISSSVEEDMTGYTGQKYTSDGAIVLDSNVIESEEVLASTTQGIFYLSSSFGNDMGIEYSQVITDGFVLSENATATYLFVYAYGLSNAFELSSDTNEGLTVICRNMYLGMSLSSSDIGSLYERKFLSPIRNNIPLLTEISGDLKTERLVFGVDEYLLNQLDPFTLGDIADAVYIPH